MATEAKQSFPTFECVISDTQEDMDSEVEYFFLKKNHVGVHLAKLKLKDKDWSANYDKMLQYLSDLDNSIVYLKDPPSHQFLIDLCMGEELEGDAILMLKNTQSEVVMDLVDTAMTAREMIFWYVRNAKVNKFARGFTADRFKGLPFLRLALVYRAVGLAESK